MSRFDGFGDSAPSDSRPPRDTGRRAPKQGSYDRPKVVDDDFEISRGTFGTGRTNNTSSGFSSRTEAPAQTSAPVRQPTKQKDADGFEFVVRGTPKEQPKKEEPKAQNAAAPKPVNQFRMLDDEDGDVQPKQQQQRPEQRPEQSQQPQQTSKPEREVVKQLEPIQHTRSAPRFSEGPPADSGNSRFGGFFEADSEPRAERPRRDERAPREDRPRRDFSQQEAPPTSNRFAAFEQEEPSSRFSDRPSRDERPQREERPPRRDFAEERQREEHRPRREFGGDSLPPGYSFGRQEPKPEPVREAPKEVVAGTNKDIDHLPTFTTVATAGKAGEMSQMATKVAGWGVSAAPSAQSLAFGATEKKPSAVTPKAQPQQQEKPKAAPVPTQKAKPETPLQKAVSGTASVVPLGQAKKNIADIVPFPTTENSKVNFGTAIATSVADQDYSLNDIITVLNKQFVDQYGRYYQKEALGTSDEGKVVGLNIAHEILVISLKALIESAMDKVAEHFKDYDVSTLVNFCPHSIISLTDASAQRTQAVDFFKASDLAKCLSIKDNSTGNDSGASTDSVDVQLMNAVIELTNPDVNAIKAVIQPLQAQIKAQLDASATAFIHSLFVPCVDKNVPKSTLIALLDALFSMELMNYELIDKWQSESSGPVKRDIFFKISSWISEHKPQVVFESQYDDEEEFDDGF